VLTVSWPTVACVYRSGGTYTQSWVIRLAEAVERNMSAHRFVCLTDLNLSLEQWNIETVPLTENWPGWWSKIELFRPGLFAGPVLYIDLDSLITGDLDRLLDTSGSLRMVGDFLTSGSHNSSVMAWTGDMREIYDRFRADPVGFRTQYDRRTDGRIGDQAFIEDVAADAGYGPTAFKAGVVASYKLHAQLDPPAGSSIVTFHGRPKMNEIKSGWVADAWSR
jgi:hypothetical protein